MKKVAFIDHATYKVLKNLLRLNELKVINTVNTGGKEVLAVIPSMSGLNTDAEKRYIYNDDKGRLYIGNGKDSGNEIKITKLLKKLWGIEDPSRLKELKSLWESYYIEVKIGLPCEVYNMKHDVNIDSCMIRSGAYYVTLEKTGLKVVYVVAKGEVIGRALVWLTGGDMKVEVYDEAKGIWKEVKGVMDRVYFADESVKIALFRWAKEMGLWRRGEQTKDVVDCFVREDGRKVDSVKMRVRIPKLPLFEWRPWPYMDTFKFMYEEGENLVLSNYVREGNGEENWVYWLEKTDGTVSRLKKCGWCGEWKRDEYWEFCEAYSEERGSFEICGDCAERDFEYIKAVGLYVPKKELMHCVCCGSMCFVTEDEGVYCDAGEHYVCDECGECVCGKEVKWVEGEEGKTPLCPLCYKEH